MKYFKYINYFVVLVFIVLNIKFYNSKIFFENKIESRKNYIHLLDKEAENIMQIKERDFKIFNENKEKFKSIENEKTYWKLLK
tara:strand:+ start:10291 stop:10539 length:249 start_codon:yes stop_codon:yes gene_type:complete